MKAIEFTTTIQKGTIKVPTRYAQSLQQECRVIILIDDKARPTKKTRPASLQTLRIKTKNLRFDRNKVI